MPGRFKLLFLLALAICALSLHWGCSQPQDVIVPAGQTRLLLTAERLPMAPPGMVYELWVTDDTTDASAFVSMGQFNWDPDTDTWLDSTGAERADSNSFHLDSDLLLYQKILVSVERLDGNQPNTPGPAMLVDSVTNPNDNPIRLRFPFSDSLWLNTAAFNMETPSDADLEANEGSGLWFSRYAEQRGLVTDTLALDSFDITIDTLDNDTTRTTYVTGISNIRDTVITRQFGLWETRTQTVVRWDEDTVVDSIPPFLYNGTYQLYFDIPKIPGSQPGDSIAIADTVLYDEFSVIDSSLANMSALGWKYKGWVYSEAVATAGCGDTLTPPAWEYKGDLTLWIPGYGTAALLSTGYFGDIVAADDQNPYSLGTRVPPVPGEDFLNTPCGVIDLVDNVSRGSAIITLEPENYYDSTVNFPLLVFIQELPVADSALQLPSSPADVDNIILTEQEYTMLNWTMTNDPVYGFPQIRVEVQRFVQ